MHEAGVAALVIQRALQWGYRVRETPEGNLLVGTVAAQRRPSVMLLAHMDHPGLQVLSVKGRTAVVGVMGGLPLDQLVGGKFIFCAGEVRVAGRVTRKRRAQWMGQPTFDVALTHPISKNAFGVLDVPSPVWRGTTVSSRALDNLINVASLLCFLHSQRRKRNSRVLCVFTRAEEVGMVGTSALIARKTLPRDVPLIVLEASSAKVGKVTPGAGPVIRVGDRIATYDPTIDLWLQSAATHCTKRNKKMRVQRALLAGGRCEATVFFANGHCTGGMAIPLGNYHNRGDKKISAEEIDWRDFVGMQELLSEIVQTPFRPMQQRRIIQRQFLKVYRRWKPLLRTKS